MSHDLDPLPSDVMALVHEDRIIEAIKRLRETTGLDLKSAKAAVDAARRGRRASLPTAAPAGPLPPGVVEAMQRGNKIEAIRRLREHAGIGLKDAKEAVDAATHGGPLAHASDGSNGIGRFLVFVAALGAGLIAYRMIRGG